MNLCFSPLTNLIALLPLEKYLSTKDLDFLIFLTAKVGKVLRCTTEVGEQSNSEVEVEVTFISLNNLKVDK